MKKLFILLVIFLLSGCSHVKPSNISQPPIKIGATLALSGNLAFIGEAERRGLQMAVDAINDGGGIGGRQLQLLIEDNQGDTNAAVSSLQNMLTTENPDVIFSAFTHITQAIKQPVADAEKILMYASTVDSIAEEHPLFFKDYSDVEDHAKKLAFAVAVRGYKKATMLSEVSDVCNPFDTAFKEEANRLGVEVLHTEKYVGEDFRTPLTKLQSYTSNAAFVSCSWKHSNPLMTQMKELGIMNRSSFQFLAPFLPVNDTAEIRLLYEENHTMSTSNGTPSGKTYDEFLATYRQLYTTEEVPRVDTLFAYDDMFILKEAIERCNSAVLDQDCIADQIRKTDYQGVSGRIRFYENQTAQRDVFLAEIKDGQWVDIQ